MMENVTKVDNHMDKNMNQIADINFAVRDLGDTKILSKMQALKEELFHLEVKKV